MNSSAFHCLVVEDNPRLREDLVFYLNSAGIHACGLEDGRGLDQHLATTPCDVVILDLGLPGEDGLTIARRLAGRPQLGLVILTARDQLEERLAGWESGAHVYLVKPVPLAEVAAVVSAVWRRLNPAPTTTPNSWQLAYSRRELTTPDGVVIPLTHRELLFMNALIESPQQQISRDLMLEQNAGASIDALVHRLRRKLKAHGDPLRTIYGAGFAFNGKLQRSLPEEAEG